MEFNKTTEFLLPYFVNKHPKLFLDTLKGKVQPVLKAGLFDCKDANYEPGNVYFLIHFNKLAKGEFQNILKVIQSTPGYVNDYLYGDILHDFLHMVVLKCEDKIFDNFIHSRYSKMFTELEMKKIYDVNNPKKYVAEKRKKALKVVSKCPILKLQLEVS